MKKLLIAVTAVNIPVYSETNALILMKNEKNATN